MSSVNLKTKIKPDKRWWLNVSAIFLFLAIVAVIWFFGCDKVYAGKIFPGVKISSVDLLAETKAEALEQFKQVDNKLREDGLRFVAEGKDIRVSPILISTSDPDLAKAILNFDWQKNIDDAYLVGRRGSVLQQFGQRFIAATIGYSVPVEYSFDRNELLAVLKSNLSELEKPPVDARLKISRGTVEVTGDKSGYVFDYEEAVNQTEKNIQSLNFTPVNFNLIFTEPKIKKQYTGSAVNSVEQLLKIDSLVLKAEGDEWQIAKTQFTPWLEFQLLDKDIVVGLNSDGVTGFLANISRVIDVEAQDVKFKMVGDRVTEFQVGRDGKKLNLDASYKKINHEIISGEGKPVDLVVEVSPAKVTNEDVNKFGIKESIGVGKSNFAGSPKNRRLNIAVGAKSLDGILIAPDEEFSLLKALGPVDGEHGYLQELVIKGNRTIPEYGGGLCQIGTTAFRVALNSGLPITMRRNHSYRVVYYEPAGMDATIYNPSPDLKFLNDTGHYILFTTRIQGDNLIFEFYGTKDGRQVDISPNPPAIYNITDPGEPRYIETTDIAVGEKKKIESSHKGADTDFKYTVTYPNGEVKEKQFFSRYVPWPEVWLIGVESTSTIPVVP